MLRRAIRRVQEMTFPATCGLASVRVDDLLGSVAHFSVRFANWNCDPGAGSFWDLTALAAIVHAAGPQLCWEIGTGRGRGTAQIAANAPADARIYTLDIVATAEIGSCFASLPERSKIIKVVGDSGTYDFSQHFGRADLVLVDGGHDYPQVARDTETALRLVGARGVILWHDFAPDWPGVVRALRESPKREQLRRIAGTAYAFYGGPESIYPTATNR
jgi:predicted O-methyltransferase YrrM